MPGADDVMLNYQSLSNHDAVALRATFGLKPAPEFEAWLLRVGLADEAVRMIEPRAAISKVAALPLGCFAFGSQ